MHDTAFAFIEEVVRENHLDGGRVFEVGANERDNGGFGSRVRHLFPNASRYYGIDKIDGPGVDMVADIEAWPSYGQPGSSGMNAAWWTESWDTVLCAEMLEHTPMPWRALHNMAAILKPGGSLILTCRGYDESGCAPVHMEPHDYWRFSRRGVDHMLENAGFKIVRSQWDPDPMWRGVLAHAVAL